MTERDLSMEAGWRGEGGNAYFWEKHDTEHRGPWWSDFLDRYSIGTVLEVGCGKGVNLNFLKDRTLAVGIDLNAQALARCPDGVLTHIASASSLPFDDGDFDLVFTSGVLIHANDVELPLQMSEIVRCSNRYVLAMEYAGDEVRPWRWLAPKGAGLWFRDYGGEYQREYGLKLLESGELHEGSWTDVTWWMLEQ